MDTAAQEMSKEAAPSQDQAAQSSQSGQNEQAQKSGEKASDALEKAAARMKSTAEQMQSDQNQLDLASVRRAAQDLVSLQRESAANLAGGQPTRATADRQTDLSEGTARVVD